MLRKVCLLATVLCLQVSLPAQQSAANTAARLKGLPVSFEETQGQVDSQVRFLAHTGKSTMYFTPGETVLTLASRDLQKKADVSVLRLKWIAANPHPQMVAEKPLPGKVNYL